MMGQNRAASAFKINEKIVQVIVDKLGYTPEEVRYLVTSSVIQG